MSKINKMRQKDRAIFFVSIVFMLIFSSSFLLMLPATDLLLNHSNNKLLMFTGALFWASLAIAYLLFGYVNIRRRKFLKSRNKIGKNPPGIVRFFSNKYAKIADITTIISLVVFIICLIFAKGYIIYVLLSITAFAFQMHCVLNGENYLYIKSTNSRGE